MVKQGRIAERREFIGVRALARELGVDASHVSRVLHGKRQSKRVEAAARTKGWKPLRSVAR